MVPVPIRRFKETTSSSPGQSLTQLVSRDGNLVDPLSPSSGSIGFSGLSAFSIDDDDILDELTASVNTSQVSHSISSTSTMSPDQ